MADPFTAPFQLPEGTVGLLILQGNNPISVVPTMSNTTAPMISMAPLTNSVTFNNNNNNNDNQNNNNNNNNNMKSYQKPIKPAPAKGKKKRKAGTTPPLKPPKKFRDEDNEITRCKRRLDFAKLGLPFNKANPANVARRNERERKRVKQINSTFSTLRDHLPSDYYQNKNPNKISKVETLRGAIEYINNLQEIVDNYDSTVKSALQSGQLSTMMSPSSPEHTEQQAANDAQFQMELSAALQSVNQMLSVQATESLQTDSVNSPTGSTCSSACSTISSSDTPGSARSSVSSEFMDMSYSASVPMYVQNIVVPDTTSSLPVSLDEQDLIEFASWF